MKLEQINEQAKLSLKKYFKDATDIKHDYTAKKEMSYDEMMAMIQNDIEKQKQRLNELNMMKSILEHDARKVYDYIFGTQAVEETEVRHATLSETRAKLAQNMNKQMTYVNELKEKALAR